MSYVMFYGSSQIVKRPYAGPCLCREQFAHH